jgi:hypothetical protein
MLAGFRALPEPENWVNGVYFLGTSLKAAIIVIHQLPRTPETLWLRILGKGNVQKQAVAELRELPSDNVFRLNALELSPLYLQRLEEATQRGIEQGIQQGIQRSQRLMIESMLQVYFGEIDKELSQLIEPLIQLEPIEIARLIMQLDRTELLAHFDASKNPPES